MIVCVCHRVSDRDITAAVKAGTATFGELQDELHVATNCGRCRDCAHEVFDAALQAGCSNATRLPSGSCTTNQRVPQCVASGANSAAALSAA